MKKLGVNQLICLRRICGLSAARIKSVLSLDPLDFTYSVVPDLVFGALEIELGIVNACLPILRPLVRKAFAADSTFFKGWSKKAEMNSDGSEAHKSSMINRNRNFERLSDTIYPLTEIVSGVPSNETADEYHVDSIYYTEDSREPRPGDIMVRRDFSMYRMSTKNALQGRVTDRYD